LAHHVSTQHVRRVERVVTSVSSTHRSYLFTCRVEAYRDEPSGIWA